MLHPASYAILFILLSKCLADSGGTAFLGPTGITGKNVEEEQTWFIGDEKHFTWNGTWAAAELNYQATDSLIAVTIGSYITNFSFIWNVDVSKSQSPTHSQYFFFYLVEWSNPKNYVVSNLIRIVQDPAEPTFTTMTSAQATSTEIETEVVTLTSSISSFVTVTDTAAKATSTLAITTTASSRPTRSASSSSSSLESTATLPQTTNTTSAVPAHSSLSTGDKVALGVAIPLGVIIALLSLSAFAWWYRRRRRTRQQKSADAGLARTPASALHDMYRSELGADAGGGVSEKPADDAYDDDDGAKRARRGVSELSGLSRPSELGATENDAMMIHEMPNSEVSDPERLSLMRRSLLSGTTLSPPVSPRTDVSRD